MMTLLLACDKTPSETSSPGTGGQDSQLSDDSPSSDSAPPQDSGQMEDSDASADSALREDSGRSEDSGSPQDSAPPEDSGPSEEAPDLSQDGSLTVGVSTHDILNRDGLDMRLELWFPSLDAGELPTVHDGYWDGASFQGVSPHCDEPHPVLLHSHGNGSIRWEMNHVAERLTSHGWMVLAPDHPTNNWRDPGRWSEYLYQQRPHDLSDSFDWLITQAQDPKSPLYGCVDPEAGFAVSGYSFGGYTAYATGGGLVAERPRGVPSLDYSDARVWAVVAYAPWNANAILGEGNAEIDVPVLTIGAERDATVWTQYEDLHAAVVSTPRWLGVFPDGGHLSFIPYACYWGSIGDGCGGDFLDIEDADELVSLSTIVFLETLRGTPGAEEQLPPDSELLRWSRH